MTLLIDHLIALSEKFKRGNVDLMGPAGFYSLNYRRYDITAQGDVSDFTAACKLVDVDCSDLKTLFKFNPDFSKDCDTNFYEFKIKGFDFTLGEKKTLIKDMTGASVEKAVEVCP